MSFEKYIINHVAKKTKWSKNKIEQVLVDAADKGISPNEYIQFSCWEMSSEELNELSVLLDKIHDRQKKEEDWLLQIAHRRSLRPISVLRKEMETFKEFGMTPVSYIRQGAFYPVKCVHAQKKVMQRKKRVAKKSMYFQKICDVTGWSHSKAEMEVAKAWLNGGANYENFFRFKMYAVDAEEQKKYVTCEQQNKMSVYFNSHVAKTLLNTKSSFNRIYSSYIKRRWFLNSNLSYAQFLKKINGLEDILVKPVSTTHGKGIQKFSCNVEDKRALYDTIMALPKSVVEEYIIQHPDIAAFCSTSVNTLRVVTLNANGNCNFLFAIIRMGRGDIVDNVHAGGITAAVDIKNGVISTHALDSVANIYEVHPISKRPIKGAQIPNWDAVIELCQKCYNKIPGSNLVGWDIAITQDGAELIEGNSAPAFASAQALALLDGKGLRAEIVDPYLPDCL